MRIKRRRRFAVGVIRAGELLKKVLIVTSAALSVRFLYDFGALDMAEKWLSSAGQNPDFIKTALMMEFPGIRFTDTDTKDELMRTAIKVDSAVFNAYDVILEQTSAEDLAEEAVIVFVPPSVSPSASPSQSPDPSQSPEPSASPPVLEESPTVSAGGFPIKSITIAPADPSGYENAQGVLINNDSGIDIDVDALLKNKSDLSITDKGPQVLIVHTHGSEAYTPAGNDIYTPTDVERTEDTNFNVVRVGSEIERILTEKGISVIHDENIYDYPSYNGAYSRTLEAINAAIKKNPSIKAIIDVHRDSMTAKDGTVYKTIADINGERVAQVMLVMGTNKGGLSHNNWKKNLTFAAELQKHMADTYPGLARPINLRVERFNQHVTTGSMLVEVGTAGNTLKEALAGARLFADSLGEVLLNYKK